MGHTDVRLTHLVEWAQEALALDGWHVESSERAIIVRRGDSAVELLPEFVHEWAVADARLDLKFAVRAFAASGAAA